MKKDDYRSASCIGKARMRLSDNGVRISVILGISLAVLSFLVGIVAAQTFLPVLLPEVWMDTSSPAADILCFGAAFLFFIPLWAGLIRLCGTICGGENPDLRELFFPFSSPLVLLRVYTAGIWQALRFGIAALLALVREFLPPSAEAALQPPFGSLITIGGFLLAVLLLRLTRTNGALLYLIVVRKQPFFRAVRNARKADQFGRLRFRIFFSMTGWHLLAIPTLFVTWIADTLPVHLFARSVGLDEADPDNETQLPERI